jgi:hypothetical protein
MEEANKNNENKINIDSCGIDGVGIEIDEVKTQGDKDDQNKLASLLNTGSQGSNEGEMTSQN